MLLASLLSVLLASVSPVDNEALKGQGWQLSMQVTPGGSDSAVSVRENGGHYRDWNGGGNLTLTRTRTNSRSMRWTADLRVRGEDRPYKAELKIYYLGTVGRSAKTLILASETKEALFDANGKASVGFQSPEMTVAKTKYRSGWIDRWGNLRNIRSRSGDRTGKVVQGCVVQVFVNGQLSRTYTSTSRWQKAAEEIPFTQESLDRRRINQLQ